MVSDNRREINNLLKDRIHACSIGVNSDSKEWTVVSTNASQTYTKAKAKMLTNPVQTKVTKLANQSKAQKNKARL